MWICKTQRVDSGAYEGGSQCLARVMRSSLEPTKDLHFQALQQSLKRSRQAWQVPCSLKCHKELDFHFSLENRHSQIYQGVLHTEMAGSNVLNPGRGVVSESTCWSSILVHFFVSPEGVLTKLIHLHFLCPIPLLEGVAKKSEFRPSVMIYHDQTNMKISRVKIFAWG